MTDLGETLRAIAAQLPEETPERLSPAARLVRTLVARRPWVTFDLLGKKGLFANQLFQIAAVVGLARTLGVDYFFPDWYYAPQFMGPFPRPRFYHVPRDDPSVSTHVVRQFHYEPFDLTPPIVLDGFYQSECFFENAADEVRRLFRPKPEILATLRQRHGTLLDRKPWALHVRRGDYLNTDWFATLDETYYYRRALAHVPPDTPILVCSDDIPFCRSYFPGERFHFIEGQTNVEDMILMSMGAGNIIANSSFSWWSAWLGETPGKPIIAPVTWFGGRLNDPTIAFQHIGFHDTRDVVPERWLRI